MIPHRIPSNEIFGNGLKDRVTACRKRLRLNRIHRAHADNHLEELFRETAIGASEFIGYSGDHSRRARVSGSRARRRNIASGSMSKRLE